MNSSCKCTLHKRENYIGIIEFCGYTVFPLGQKSNRVVGGANQIPQEVINLIKPII